MKQRTKYMCEFCGTEYVEKERAEECEKGHKRLKFKNATYKPIGMVPGGYPTKIFMKTDSGEVYRYGFEGEANI